MRVRRQVECSMARHRTPTILHGTLLAGNQIPRQGARRLPENKGLSGRPKPHSVLQFLLTPACKQRTIWKAGPCSFVIRLLWPIRFRRAAHVLPLSTDTFILGNWILHFFVYLRSGLLDKTIISSHRIYFLPPYLQTRSPWRHHTCHLSSVARRMVRAGSKDCKTSFKVQQARPASRRR